MSNNPFETIDARLSNIENLLLDIKHPPKEPTLSDRCTLKDACNITGLGKAAIYKLTHEKKIPHSKFGSRLVFSRRQLTSWVEAHTINPLSPEEALKAKLIKSANKKLDHEK